MHRLIAAAILLLPTLLPAQGQTGRQYHRHTRTVATAPAAPVAEASAPTEAAAGRRVEPLRRLRSGRAWSSHHFGRRPVTPAVGVAVVEASAEKPVRRTTFWGRRLPR